MFDFENLHPNQKMAFIDGFLCGIVTAFMARTFYNDYREMKALEALAEESRQAKASN